MAGKELEFLKAPEENLKTWNLVWKLMILSAAAVMALLLIMLQVFV